VKRFKYTTEHLEFLRTGYQSMHTRDLAKAFNKRFKLKKKESAIRSALRNHKIYCGRAHGERLITPKRLMTEEQDSFLRVEYKHHAAKETTDRINNKFDAGFTYQQIKAYVKNNKIGSGRTGQFKTGHVPANKGTRGFMKPNRTSFKKGDIPVNVRPIGSERICSKDGYVIIKVGEWDHNFNRPTRWKAKHVHVWEQENGPVPDGFVLKFKDGDVLNIDPENLMAIPKALNLRLNTHGYNDAPDSLKPSVLALAKLEVKTFSVEKKI
jgi:HNH endonuclease